jgi:hypothetical protein
MNGAATWAGGRRCLPLSSSKPQATTRDATMELEGAAAWGAHDDKEAAREVESSSAASAARLGGCSNTLLQFLRFVGPGILMCIAFLDPGNLGER